MSVPWIKRGPRGNRLRAAVSRTRIGPTRSAVLGLGGPRPRGFLGVEAEGVQNVVPEALFSVDYLLDETRLPLRAVAVGWFGVVRGTGRRRRRPVRGLVRGAVTLVGRVKGWSGNRKLSNNVYLKLIVMFATISAV